VDRTKLILTSDLSRRWALAAIATEVGVSPVYLTQVFQQAPSDRPTVAPPMNSEG
jgi:AraC-like DNA-binding protein